MSNSLADLASYPGLVPSQQQLALGQALMSAGASGPTQQQSQSGASPLLSLVQALTGNYLKDQGQAGVQSYAQQQNQALASALQQQNSILTGDSSQGIQTGGGLQGASSGTLSTNTGANNTPPSPAPRSSMTAATPNGTGGFHIPGASPYVTAVMQGESGGNVSAANPSSTALGAGQFTVPTWQTFASANPSLFQGMSPSDVLASRTDPSLAAAATDWLAGQNAQSFREGGIAPTGPNLALAHNLGAQGAAAVIRAQPGTPVSVALGSGLPGADVQADLKANPQFASMTVDQLRGKFASVPDYQVASADTGTATDAMPSPSAPPSDTAAIAGGMTRAGGAPISNPQMTAQLLSGGSAAPPVAPAQQALSKALQLYQLGQQDAVSANPRLQAVGQSQIELARTLMQRGQFQTITLPDGVQAQRNLTTGETTALPQRSVTTIDGTAYDVNTGQPIAGGVGAGGVRNQDVQGASLNTLATLAPRIQSGVATPQEHAAYSSAASAFQGAPQTYQKADGTTGTYVRPLPQGFPDPSAPPPAAGAPVGTPPAGVPSGPAGTPVSGTLPGPTNAAAALPKQQAQDTGAALVTTIPTLRAAGQTGQRVIDQVGQIKQALASATANGLPQGYFSPELGEAAAAAKYLGVNIPGLQPGAVPNQQVAEATLKQFGGAVLKTMFPSRITNADISLFLPSMGDLSHDPQAVSKILDNASAYANYDVAKSQSMERQLANNGGQLPPTWEANYNLVHGSAAHLAPIPSPQQSAQLGWGGQGVPADVSNLNGFGNSPQHGAPPVGTVATNPQSGEQQVLTKLGWRSYAPGQGVSD